MSRLKKYKIGQYDLICDAIGCGKHFNDTGCTAYEAVCVLLGKLNVVREYLSVQPGQDAKEVLNILDTHHDHSTFDIIQMF